MKSKPAARVAKPEKQTIKSDDLFAGRSFAQRSSNVQELPEGDSRYRVNHSEKFYVVQLIGSWLNVSESAERTVKYRNRLRWVQFENREYELRKARDFKPFLRWFIKGGCYAYVGSKQVETVKQLEQMTEQNFIYIASSEALKIFKELREKRNT